MIERRKTTTRGARKNKDKNGHEQNRKQSTEGIGLELVLLLSMCVNPHINSRDKESIISLFYGKSKESSFTTF